MEGPMWKERAKEIAFGVAIVAYVLALCLLLR
jgi:hypothetical protein